MGQVYTAYDPQLDRRVALKLLVGADTPAHRERLRREARALARLSHPNVVTVHEVDEYDGTLVIAMEYVDGKTLKQWQLQHPSTAEPARIIAALDLLLQAGRGLAAAHDAGLIHRDVKPSNLLLGRDGRVRVADFGLAQGGLTVPQPANVVTADVATDSITRTGVAVGTPAYMAPEQSAGAPLDRRTDIYSFCIVAWELLHGVRPNSSDRRSQIGEAIVPVEIGRAIRKGFSDRPGARFSSLAPLLSLFEKHLAVARGEHRKRRSRVWILAGMSLIGLLAAGTYELQRLRNARRVEACVTQGELIGEVWNRDVETSMVRSLKKTTLGRLSPVGSQVAPWVSEYADSWRNHATAACMNATVHETWTSHEYEAARWCLKDRRLELRALLDQLIKGSDTSAINAVDAATGLTPVALCTTGLGLATPLPPWELRDDRQIMRLREQLFTNGALVATGELDAAEKSIFEGLQAADALQWPPLLAAYQLSYAALMDAKGTPQDGTAFSRAAFFTASNHGAWNIAAAAANRMVRSAAAESDGDMGLVWSDLDALAISWTSDPLGIHSADRELALAALYWTDNREKAIALAWSGIAHFKATFGAEHPRTLNAIVGLARMMLDGGDLGKAIELQMSVLEARRRIYSENHPYIAESYEDLSTAHIMLGELDQGEDYLNCALDIKNSVFGSDSNRLAPLYENLAALHLYKENPEDALPLANEALRRRRAGLGPFATATLHARINAAVIQSEMQQFDEAAAEFRGLLAMETPPLTVGLRISALMNLGSVLIKRRDYEEANSVLQESISLQRAVVPVDLGQLAHSLTLLSQSERGLGHFEEAIAHLRDSIAISEQLGDTRTASLAYNSLGYTYLRTDALFEALEAWTTTYNLQTKMLDPTNPLLQKIRGKIRRELCEERNYEPACEFVRRVETAP